MSECMNLDLQVRGNKATGYRVEASGPAAERASGGFAWEVLADLTGDVEAIRTGRADRARLERVGRRLFEALFPRQVLRLYDRIRPKPGEERQLRLRLHLPPELASLPWEMLYDQSRYLSFDPRLPILRFLDLADTPSPLHTEAPMRLLHLIADPIDAARLDVKKEAHLLNSALAPLARQQLAEILPGRPGTLETLRRGLRQGCHVLHFSGHGRFADGEGMLLFEDESGHQEEVDRDTLAHLLQGSKVRLAVLNACESAQASEHDAFTSVAAALVRVGLPAVIAHQCPMPDISAIAFAAEFYRALADGLPVDAAVCEGRRAILSELGAVRWERTDWAAPVLFLRAPDGQILTLDQKAEDAGMADRAPIGHTTTVNVESINGGIVSIGAFAGAALGGSQPAEKSTSLREPTAPQPGERLPVLLSELGQKVRVLAPREKRPLAREQVASLERALTGERLDPAALAEAWDWFQSELPSLSGATLSVIREAKPLAEQEGETTLDEFVSLFGEF
jgi:hypothetical protein